MRLYQYLKEMSDAQALQVFGISPDDIGNKTLIKKRYRELAKTYHPDTIKKKDMIGLRQYYQDDRVEKPDMMVQINLAYEKIKKMKPKKATDQAVKNLMKDLGSMFGKAAKNMDPKEYVKKTKGWYA